eukprot:GEZU01035949.1.p1 GENE.GEZU01035949.1~~GEZU01035949.1.p1  ORF type:complete len:300 (+),score=80.26 GEZU01035949.1:100-999(+)
MMRLLAFLAFLCIATVALHCGNARKTLANEIQVPTITASPLTLAKSGDIVTITWMSVPKPTANDFIAIYSPPIPQSVLSSNDPAPYLDNWMFQIFVDTTETWQWGFGTVEFPLPNLRNDYQIHYIQNNGSSSVCHSSNITFQHLAEEPTQGHLAFGAKDDEMIVMWVSNVADEPTVQYGLKSNYYHESVKAFQSKTYTIDDMCGAPANETMDWRNPGLFHTARLSDLLPNTVYYYRFGDLKHGVFSEESYFRTKPLNHRKYLRGGLQSQQSSPNKTTRKDANANNSNNNNNNNKADQQQ